VLGAAKFRAGICAYKELVAESLVDLNPKGGCFQMLGIDLIERNRLRLARTSSVGEDGVG